MCQKLGKGINEKDITHELNTVLHFECHCIALIDTYCYSEINHMCYSHKKHKLKFKQVLQNQTLHDRTGIFVYLMFFNQLHCRFYDFIQNVKLFFMFKLSKN